MSDRLLRAGLKIRRSTRQFFILERADCPAELRR